MVQCHMYCAEQIIIPETLPNILKTYVKAAIRTQPYDLLRWSAAYFRCLAINVPPPVKPRLEKDSNFGCLTKGYLRVLLAQVGKGYYIRRDVLQKRWEGLCLPEEELFKFLSLCRMFNWTQIHWLKLFAVMVGSLSHNIKETAVTICELLTEENDGGSASVPIWLFHECYSFIANMDCSVEQKFINGRKILSTGELEEQKPIPLGPKILSSMAFRDAVLEEWKKYLDDDEHTDDMNNAVHENCIDLSRDSEIVSQASGRASRISSTFMFVGDYQDAQVIGKSPDFDSIIVLLHEAQSENLRKYEGSAFITEKNLDNAKKRELKILEKRNQISQTNANQIVEYLNAERINLLKEIGPPWSWLYQFASQNCRDKSYNFVEAQSIVSDITPPESSDESFDFEQEKFLMPEEKDNQSNFSESSDVRTLLTNENIQNDYGLNFIMKNLEEALDSNEIFVENTSSILNYLNKMEKEASKTYMHEFDYEPLKEFLVESEKNSLVFRDLNELFEYFKAPTKNIYNEYPETLEKAPLKTAETHKSPVIETNITAKSNNSQKLQWKKEINYSINQASFSEPDSESSETENVKTDMKDIFMESGIEVPNRLLTIETSEPMILGLANKKPEVLKKPAFVKQLKEVKPFWADISTGSESTIPVSTSIKTSGTHFSDISSKVSLNHNVSKRPKKKNKNHNIVEMDFIDPVEPFTCKIPPLIGIGKAVSSKTIQAFLTYLRYKSREQKGLIFPRNFMEDQCPNMIDPI